MKYIALKLSRQTLKLVFRYIHMTLREETDAPDFKGAVENGKLIGLTEYLGKTNIVLYFYPKDNSPGCTREACKFRDEFEEFSKLDAVIIGVNRGSLDSHKRFREKRELPFEIISDSGGEIYKAYDVKGGILSERVTYIIDKKGKIRGVFNSQLKYLEHPDFAKRVLSVIAKESDSLEKKIN